MDVKALIATWHARHEADQERFRRHFPESDDMLAIVLRGHLLVEEYMDRLNRHCFHFPKYYDQARLTFSKKLLIARAQVLVPFEDQDEFFEPIASLNALRNNLAHDLDPPNLEARAERFLSSVEPHYPANGPARASSTEVSLEDRLRRALAFMLGQLSMIDYVVECMERSREYGSSGGKSQEE